MSKNQGSMYRGNSNIIRMYVCMYYVFREINQIKIKSTLDGLILRLEKKMGRNWSGNPSIRDFLHDHKLCSADFQAFQIVKCLIRQVQQAMDCYFFGPHPWLETLVFFGNVTSQAILAECLFNAHSPTEPFGTSKSIERRSLKLWQSPDHEALKLRKGRSWFF